MLPQAPTIASQGLITIDRSGSIGRAPAFSSRVKHSWILRKRVFLASFRSRSENSRQMLIDRPGIGICSIRLNQPMNCV